MQQYGAYAVVTWRHSTASWHTRTTASGSSPLTWKMGAPTPCTRDEGEAGQVVS
jgi:hypothetical protein